MGAAYLIIGAFSGLLLGAALTPRSSWSKLIPFVLGVGIFFAGAAWAGAGPGYWIPAAIGAVIGFCTPK